MSTKTKNFEFVKPDLTDPADIRVINTNFDKLDDMKLLIVEEYKETSVDDYTMRVTKYNSGLMVIEYCLTGEHTVTFPTPFKDDTYICTSEYTNKTAECITISRDSILRGRFR